MFRFFMGPLSSISIISWSINNSCVLDVATCFGIALCTEIFKNGITYPLLQIKCPDLGWTFVRDSSIVNSGNFLDKGARFWCSTLLTWDTAVPFAVLFPTILCIMSASIVRFFTLAKLPSTTRFVVVSWWACPKGLFGRRRNAATSTRKTLQSSFLGAFCFNNMRSELFAKKILMTFLK